MGVAAAAGLGGVGLLGTILAANSEADAIEKMTAQQRIIFEESRKDVFEAAAPTENEIQLLMQNTKRLTQVFENNKALVASLDPALAALGAETKALLEGKEAAVLAPFREIQDRDRERLRAKLHDQLGPGFEESTIGRRILSDFEASSSLAAGQLQHQTVRDLTQLTIGARPNLTADILAGTELLRTAGAPASRLTAGLAQLGSGAKFAPGSGDVARARSFGDLFGDLTEAGAVIGTVAALRK